MEPQFIILVAISTILALAYIYHKINSQTEMEKIIMGIQRPKVTQLKIEYSMEEEVIEALDMSITQPPDHAPDIDKQLLVDYDPKAAYRIKIEQLDRQRAITEVILPCNKECPQNVNGPKNLITVPQKPKVNYNPYFIFHTKLPKAGSTTIYNILKILSENRNKFIVTKMSKLNYYGPWEIERLKKYFKKLSKKILISPKKVSKWGSVKPAEYEPIKPIIVVKHHYPVDFSEGGPTGGTHWAKSKLPTFINVIREPSSWFESHYYFERFGRRLNNHSGINHQHFLEHMSYEGMSEEKALKQELTTDINECIEEELDECTKLQWTFFRYVCNNCPKYNYLVNDTDWREKNKITDTPEQPYTMKNVLSLAKHELLTKFYVIGILEDFDMTLKLFEKMMPYVFGGALEVSKSEEMKVITEASKTTSNEAKISLNDYNKEILRKGILKYEVEYYEFARAVFWQQVRSYGLV